MVLSTNVAEGVPHGGGAIILRKCVFTSGNKVIYELWRYCHHFLFNPLNMGLTTLPKIKKHWFNDWTKQIQILLM
jgi:hypothetical protein